MSNTHLVQTDHIALDSASELADGRGHFHLWRWIMWAALGLAAIGASVVYVAYWQEMQGARARLAAGSQVVQTRHGALEYHMEGNGQPVLVVHGAGGGYDQGMLIAQAFGGAKSGTKSEQDFRWIAVSRFGYLRSEMPADGSTQAQAEAFADLLDSLGIQRVAILAMSGGVPPSLQFARLYPERVSALVLLSGAPFTPLTAGEQKLPVPIWVYQSLFSSDFPVWLIQKIAPHSLDAIFDVTPALRARLTPEEQGMVAGVVNAFQPVTWRVKGLANEGAAIDPQATYETEAIKTPTLVVHAEDDHINPFPIGQYIATHIPGATLLPLPSGGHLLLGHQAEVRAAVDEFLRQHASED
jgi:pimeloyl-ACP methyl ester carboxylesterase